MILAQLYYQIVDAFQVAVPSRTDVLEYKDLKETIDKMVGAINGKYSTPAWSPIRYIFGSIGQNDLVAFYRDADVALVTPLRDGMNLVCKEFVVQLHSLALLSMTSISSIIFIL